MKLQIGVTLLALVFNTFTARAAVIGREMCRSAISSKTSDEKMAIFKEISESGLILSPFHSDALIKAAIERKMISTGWSSNSARAGEMTATRNSNLKTGLRKLSQTLRANQDQGENARRELANEVIQTLEKTVLPKVMLDDSINGLATTAKSLEQMYASESLRPSTKDAQKAARVLYKILDIPGGREFLIDIYTQANPAMARWASRAQNSDGKAILSAFKALAITEVVAYVAGNALGWYDLHGYYNNHWADGDAIVALDLFGGVGGFVAGYAAPYVQPLIQTRLKIRKAFQTWRIGRVLKKNAGAVSSSSDLLPVESSPLTATNKDKASEPTDSALATAFEREVVKAKSATVGTDELSSIVITPENAATFGDTAMGQIDEVQDLVAVMTKRMSLFEGEIDKLSSSIQDGKLTIKLEDANVLTTRVLESASSLSLDGLALRDYVDAVSAKLEAHLNYAQNAIKENKLAPETLEELEGASYELSETIMLLKPSAEVASMVVKIAQAQKPFLRDIRINLRKSRSVDSGAINSLLNAFNKLKEVVPKLLARTNE
jgi:hypothetical protein